MIHPNLITRKADEDEMTAQTVERDYVLAHVLTAIAERDREAQFVFKGGTSLRLCHFDDYRYSADLDFSLVNGLDTENATGASKAPWATAANASASRSSASTTKLPAGSSTWVRSTPSRSD